MIAAMQTLNRAHRAPAGPLPAGAADCHMHVFGPFEHFALAAERAYTVAAAPLAAHERMKRQVGLERTVRLQKVGVRGIRLNLHTFAGRYPGDRAALVERFARLVAPLGWHLQFFSDAATLAALESVLARAP